MKESEFIKGGGEGEREIKKKTWSHLGSWQIGRKISKTSQEEHH